MTNDTDRIEAHITTIGIPVNAIDFVLTKPVRVRWNPKPDITTYELARLLPLLQSHRLLLPYDLPTEPELLRHLEVHDPNKEQS